LLTCDALFQGKLVFFQHHRGYRFSLDAVLVAGLTKVAPKDRVIDLGTGCGVIPLILAYRGKGREWVGVELQPELAELARKNVEANRGDAHITILERDFREIAEYLGPASFDLVISNPPYRRLQTGRINPNQQRAMARHELAASVADVFAAGSHLLPAGGRLAVIYPAARLAHLLVVAKESGFSPRRLTIIHSDAQSPGRLVHLECLKEGGENLCIEPPLYIYQADGQYSKAIQDLYECQVGNLSEHGTKSSRLD
jgi:tRNA1Val (adenine37-N6)-methyltransferase